MDELNQEIVRLLGEDGRMPNKRIAQLLGISEPTVASRIRNLIDKNMLRIVAQRNARTEAGQGILAILEFYLGPEASMEDLVAEIHRRESFLIAYETARRPEIIAFVRAANLGSLNALVGELSETMAGVGQLTVLPILDVSRYPTSVANLHSHQPRRDRPDSADERLIELLEIDGRQSVRALAKTLSLSETAVTQRLSRLLRETSLAIRPVCDARAMGFDIWADLRLTVAPGALAAAVERMTAHPDVIITAHICGPENLHVFLSTGSVEELDSFIRDEIRTLAGLGDYSIRRVPTTIKYNYNYILA